MTINNPELCPFIREIHRIESRLDYLLREGRLRELQEEMANLTAAVREAEWIIHDIKK